MSTDPVLLVHGGAWAIPDNLVAAHLNGVRNALAAGWNVLQRGGSALDAVEEVVVVMESTFVISSGAKVRVYEQFCEVEKPASLLTA